MSETESSGTVEGYRNYETFVMAVDLANDRMKYEECIERTLEALHQCDDPELEAGSVALALHDWQQEQIPELEAEGPWSSLMLAGFQSIDWFEIAQEWIENANPRRDAS